MPNEPTNGTTTTPPAGDTTPPSSGDGGTPPAGTTLPAGSPLAGTVPPVDWKTGIPEGLQGDERFKGFKDVGELAQAFADTPAAPDVPKDAAGYTIPEGITLPELGEAAHKLGMTQAQLDGILQYNVKVNQDMVAEVTTKRETELKALKDEWGENWDKNLGQAKQVLTHFDTDGVMTKFLNDSRAGDNPTIIKFLQNIGNLLREDGFLKTQTPKSGAGKTLAERIYPAHGSEGTT